MYTLKRFVLRSIIVTECVIFFGFYFFGSRGLPLLRRLRAENMQQIADIMVIEEEAAIIQNEIDEWHVYPFFQEKLAREELQLINPGDTVYFIR